MAVSCMQDQERMEQQPESFQFTSRMSQALRLINTTGRHIYLTGKAGTGKTTFLRSLPEHTYKQHIIVAPTGIAALNAGGTTIHSQFLLPFGMFIPDRNYAEPPTENANWYTETVLAKRHPINSVRKQVLRTIDLLIIDEVSMLRADLLDAIDYRLRYARNNYAQRFGGVQLLLIGDLYQLPPVVKKEEEYKLQQFYRTSWFFESKALQQDGFSYVELDKIFRQRDRIFIDLLNNLRHNCPTHEDINTLNEFYHTPETIRELKEVITLTTHNYKADEMNRRALEALPSVSRFFDAEIQDDFPEGMYPVSARLELKVGAQIMFIRNDSEAGVYFNGKLATVSEINWDSVVVIMAGTNASYTLQKVMWENKKYTISESTKELVENVTGTFSQYPVKLAWAITVHKSQGLTFEKAIIDVGSAFADGQVYVALSRLRSIEGLILRTRIDPSVVSTDRLIVSFDEYHNKPDALDAEISLRQKRYLIELTGKTFDFEPLARELAYLIRSSSAEATLSDKTMHDIPHQISDAIASEAGNTRKYRDQLRALAEADKFDDFLTRVSKGMGYYQSLLLEQRKSLVKHIRIATQAKRGKKYINDLTDLDQLMGHYWMQVAKVFALAEAIVNSSDTFDFSEAQRANEQAQEAIASALAEVPLKKSKKRKGRKKASSTGYPDLADLAVHMVKEGSDIGETATKLNVTHSMIENQLAESVEGRRVMVTDLINREAIDEITAAIAQMKDGFVMADLETHLQGKYAVWMLRAVISDLVTRDNLH
ncbi:AAA family ATPase [Chryseolinea sp. T2]|uniref:AAA family ATPase n=1 Tax=Chryseolinea sp. T2 TaxID=3129255 RepID=UPI003077F66E